MAQDDGLFRLNGKKVTCIQLQQYSPKHVVGKFPKIKMLKID